MDFLSSTKSLNIWNNSTKFAHMFPPINNMSEIGSDNVCVPIGKS